MGTTHTQKAGRIELIQSRIVTNDVTGLGRFYGALVDTVVVTNDYYVEVGTRAQRIGLSRMRYSDLTEGACGPPEGVELGAVILDFAADDLDAEHDRILGLDVDWLMAPTLQPWGRRSMMLRDPEGHLINVFEKKEGDA
jgi:predicted enzyme related to lactoylglutathione lyase